MSRESLFVPFKYSYVNIMLCLLIIVLCGIGSTLLYSALFYNNSMIYFKQIYSYIFFLGILFMISIIKLDIIQKYSYHFYVLMLLLLLIADIIGHSAMGAQRWVKLGSLNLQPSEFMKIALILMLAKFFHNLHFSAINDKLVLICCLLLGLIPAVLIYRQPNLGNVLLILSITVNMLFLAGVHRKFFLVAGMLIVLCIPLLWNFLLYPYQKRRILTFLDPESDIFGSGYNILQSKIAIGSGGMWGQGFLYGSQNKLNFLPEKHTDFIFSLLAEEWGFIGVLFVFCILIMIFRFIYIIAYNSEEVFAKLVVLGLSFNLFMHIIINCAMISSLMPVVGIPFPMLSYGGSNLSATMLSFGLILCVNNNNRLRRKIT